MTISQAGAVNIVWDYLARENARGMEHTPDTVASAMQTLAAGASKALGAGVRPDQVSADKIVVRP